MNASMQDYADALQFRADLTAKREAEKTDEAKAAYDAAIKVANDYIANLKLENPDHG